MYGDLGALAGRAHELRALATETRQSAKQLSGSVDGAWMSTAGDAFTQALSDRARDFEAAALALEDAARAIDDHITSAGAVKVAIVNAEHFVTERWNDARRLVGNAVEVVQDGVAKVFQLFGQPVPDFLVQQAHDVLHAVPSLPSPGSIDWLEHSDTFHRRGW